MDIRRREYIKHKILGVLFLIMAAVLVAAFEIYDGALLVLLFAAGALTAKEEDFDNE